MAEILTPQIIEMLLEALAALVLAFLLWVGNKAIGLYEKVSKTKVSAEQRSLVQAAIRASASYADELARKYAKGLITSGPQTGEQKLEVAMTEVRKREPELTEKLSDGELQKLIESELPALRASIIPPPSPPLTPSGRPLAGSLLPPPPLGSLTPPTP